MTPSGEAWNEATLSEDPAIEHLQRLGYTYVPPEQLETGRQSQRDVILSDRLAAALQRLNPWLSPDNTYKATRTVTALQAASLIEASEKLHTMLTYGIALEQDLGDGKRNHPVRFFDFDTPHNNDFVVTRQLRVQGTKKNIRPDVVVFVNGIPLVLIECKSPTLGEAWKQEALDQFSRYQEMEDKYRELGAPQLFHPLQLLIATCGQAAVYGTVLTPHRFYVAWKDPYPRTIDDLARDLGRAPNAQEILFEGTLAPANLLDIVRNFIVFERDDKTGRVIRKLCRYQQFGAVNKALARARAGQTPTERGGVVWHTQGSGKSLTMLWLALKLRRDRDQQNPTLLIVTDRKDLDEQIGKTFVACGFPNPDRAEGVHDLKRLLKGSTGRTVLTTVHKFQEVEAKTPGVKTDKKKRKDRALYPELSADKNVFVLVDEAHRTQYGGFAGNLRNALPNACFFAFTGTPIEKDRRHTEQKFGKYIDQYTILRAVEDGAIVPIFYESRLPDLRIVGNTLDALFDRVFADRTEEEREAIKKKFGKESAIAGAPRRIQAICLDLLDHYTKFIQPNGFKAQIVAVNRETAALYKKTLDELNGPMSACIISSTNKDTADLVPHRRTDEQRKDVIKRFCTAGDPLSILIVCDMLITGFDAPIEQVMYLDSPLKEHTLLQAIARVNRVYNDVKTYGLVVDYWGVSDELTEALAIFAPGDVKSAMTPKTDELPRLQARHQAAMRFFANVKDKDDLDACVAVLGPEDVRAEFQTAWKRLAESVDMLLPDPRALPYVNDTRWLGKIRATAAAKYRDGKIDISDCGAKVKKLIEEAVIAEGIQILVQKVALFSPEFDQKLAALKTDEARASEMEHALKNEIHVKLEEDPVFYTSLRERLEKLLEDRKAQRIDAAQQLALFEQIKKEARERDKLAASLGLSEAGLAIYGLIAEPEHVAVHEPKAAPYGAKVDEQKRELASLLEEQLAPQMAIVDWQQKDDVQREMRRRIKRQLKAAGFAAEKVEGTAEGIVELMKRRRAT
jgi:type I restriction enzyme, R subunit